MYMTYVADSPSLLKESRPFGLKIKISEEFRPTWLVRTSDMERVPGTEAIHGYCTLSYSWNYSGDIFLGKNGKYDFFDHGKHQIIFKKNIKKRNGENDEGEEQEKEEQEKEKAGQSSFLDHHEIKEVKFEQLVQQVCKDFDIDYIWYDKICIDQNDKAAKHAEIARMHKIYLNALYTVAMIPEMSIPDKFEDTSVTWKDSFTTFTDGDFTSITNNDGVEEKRDIIKKCLVDIGQSQWLQRLWTLEEAIMSNYIVFVGRNTHLWDTYRVARAADSLGFDIEISNNLFELKNRCDRYSANFILRHAHARSTTKEHDRAFALGNIFHNLMDVKVDYGLSLDTVLSNFYSDLIEKDLSVLCFGKARDTYKSTIQVIHHLPSWTGIEGAHVSRELKFQLKDQEIQDIIKIDRRKK
ncbi:hypothetical protein BDA99DRAFT_259317 [Phascolomyces articulosus]|uniref:Heterokaryon incompatibility domain-containing protein n=1 Tax=Phascolomyces articulosus TaxID=60185 RepID=A0AAD5P841_9FUNG|nr:hypothetical protein BDA99DRAFT_259317 [Phascolomyces articulosus]